jgi:L-alanine-DL-glutamate epimerase-like enolase superfamily enzyme
MREQGRRLSIHRWKRKHVKISRIALYTTELPYSAGVYRLSAGRTYESFDASIVRITCDDGTEGWGEGTPRRALARRRAHHRMPG